MTAARTERVAHEVIRTAKIISSGMGYRAA